MKKFTLLGLSLLCASAMANPISKEEALALAQAYLAKPKTISTLSLDNAQPTLSLVYEGKAESTRTARSTTQSLYYVFDNSEGGFIVISGDDAIEPVLGVTTEGNFDENNLPEGLKWWLYAVGETVSALASGEEAEAESGIPTSDFPATVSPLIKAAWGQYGPYNNMCPTDETHDGTSLTGCTATAMAQILYYWKYPESAKGQVSYTTTTHRMAISEDLSTFTFDWDNMLDDYYDDATDAQREAVAKLNYACGITVNMDYCATVSGGWPSAKAFVENFSMDPTCTALFRVYFTPDEWEAILKTELSEGRPVLYVGTAIKSSHSFICDGYDEDGMFHINWGWDGLYSGYFLLKELNSMASGTGQPSNNYTYNMAQNIVLGIQPDTNGEAVDKNYIFFNNLSNYSAATTRSRVSLTANSVQSDGNGYSGTIALGIYDNDSLIATIGSSSISFASQPIGTLRSTNRNFSGSISADDVPDGTYTVRPVAKIEGGEYEPVICRKGRGDVTYLTMVVSGDSVSLTAPDNIDSKLSIVGEATLATGTGAVGTTNTIAFVIRNDGALYNGPVSVYRGSTLLTRTNQILETGEEVTMKASITAPDEAGEDVLTVYRMSTSGSYSTDTIGTISYTVITEEEVEAPNIRITRIVLDQTSVTKSLPITFTATNTGGYFSDYVYFYIYNSSYSYAGYGYTSFSLAKGATDTFTASINVSNFSTGYYYMAAYYGGAYISPSTSWFYVTNEQSTGIEDVELEVEAPKDIRTLSGVKINSLDNVPKGIYIVDGKKVLVK